MRAACAPIGYNETAREAAQHFSSRSHQTSGWRSRVSPRIISHAITQHFKAREKCTQPPKSTDVFFWALAPQRLRPRDL
jgi:hypothetical protein